MQCMIWNLSLSLQHFALNFTLQNDRKPGLLKLNIMCDVREWCIIPLVQVTFNTGLLIMTSLGAVPKLRALSAWAPVLVPDKCNVGILCSRHAWQCITGAGGGWTHQWSWHNCGWVLGPWLAGWRCSVAIVTLRGLSLSGGSAQLVCTNECPS